MKRTVLLLTLVLPIAAFIAVYMLILDVSPNEHKIDALSSAISTFETMLTDNQQRESIPVENVIAIEKAIRKFESRRRWQYVGNYIMAVVFGLIASGALVTMVLTISHRLMNSKSKPNQQPRSVSKP